jgi:hypothetical protein
MALTTLLLTASGLSIAILVVQYAIAYLQSPLKKLPGPFLAHFSDVWRLWNHYSQTHIETQRRLHEKYGNIVRIGPKTVSVTDPELIKTIYSTRGTFVKVSLPHLRTSSFRQRDTDAHKSEYYSVNDAIQDGQRISNIFGTRSNDFHTRQIRPIRHLYKPAFATELEPVMNDTVRVLCTELEQRFMQGANVGKTCDIGEWISYFVWDFLGDMTFSKRMGFMEQGHDVDGTLESAEKVMRYFSVVRIPTSSTLYDMNLRRLTIE